MPREYAYLLLEPVGTVVYLAPVTCGGGCADTKAELPGLRLRLSRLRSRADKTVSGRDGAVDSEGDGTLGVAERGGSSCVQRLVAGNHSNQEFYFIERDVHFIAFICFNFCSKFFVEIHVIAVQELQS